MTTHPHLKARVRARMARTGESYMTARGQVLAAGDRQSAAEPSAAGSTPLVPVGRWHHVPGSRQPSTAVVRSLLANAGVRDADGEPPSEGLALGLSGGIHLGVFNARYEAEDYSSLFLTARPLADDLPLVQGALERAGADVIVEEPGARTADAALRAALPEAPVAAWVDLAELGIAGLSTAFAGAGYHVTVVLDHDGTQVRLGDLGPSALAVDPATLHAARGRIKRYRHRTLRIRSIQPLGVDALTRRGLAASAATLRTPPRGTGPAALDQLVAEMRGGGGARDWRVRFAPGPNLLRALLGLHRFVETWGTGGGLVRPLFADFLGEAADRLQLEALADAAETWHDAGLAWSALAAAALPDGFPALAALREADEARAAAYRAGTIAGPAPITPMEFVDPDAAAALAADPEQCNGLVADLADRLEAIAGLERRATEQTLAAAGG